MRTSAASDGVSITCSLDNLLGFVLIRPFKFRLPFYGESYAMGTLLLFSSDYQHRTPLTGEFKFALYMIDKYTRTSNAK